MPTKAQKTLGFVVVEGKRVKVERVERECPKTGWVKTTLIPRKKGSYGQYLALESLALNDTPEKIRDLFAGKTVYFR